MRFANLIAVAFFIALFNSGASSQTAKTIVNAPIGSIEEQLQDRNILLERSAIVEALQNADGEVRELAALKLADDKAVNEIPSILKAVKSEKVTEVQIQMNFALAELGEKSGSVSLKSLCDDTTRSASTRLGAAQAMLGLHSEDCLGAVIGILRNNVGSGAVAHALGVLSGFDDTFKSDPARLTKPITQALADPTPYVRMCASRALGNLGVVSAIPELEFAAAGEHDEGVHTQIEVDLRILRKAAMTPGR